MNVKPGDLAVIIRADHPETRANIGAIVRVIKRFPFDVLLDRFRRVSWIVRSEGRPLVGFKDGGVGAEEEIGVFDADLRPLRPDEAPETREESELALCVHSEGDKS
jgi:hypothetical protein